MAAFAKAVSRSNHFPCDFFPACLLSWCGLCGVANSFLCAASRRATVSASEQVSSGLGVVWGMDEPVLDERHYILFGHIITLYAKAEVGFRCALSMMLGLPFEAAVLVTSPYTTRDLRDAVKAAAKETLSTSPEVQQKLIWLVGEHASLSKFRNDIAHNTWARGSTPLSIQPIKADVRDGRLKTAGYRAGDPEYSTDEMTTLQNKARKIVSDLYDLLFSDEFEQAMASKTEVSSFSSDAAFR